MNTLNICLGHKLFPPNNNSYIDFMMSPKLINFDGILSLICDNFYGENGHSLSEYAQLIWLYDNIDIIAKDKSYLNIFHYRRFTTTADISIGNQSKNLPWAITIKEDDLGYFQDTFNRTKSLEIFNTPVEFNSGILGNYASVHIFEDFLNFVIYLVEYNILSTESALRFLNEKILIPSCNIGVFKINTFLDVFKILSQASKFLYSNKFKVREGYQRRVVGFLLERLNSFLLLERFRLSQADIQFGKNIVISDTDEVSITVNI